MRRREQLGLILLGDPNPTRRAELKERLVLIGVAGALLYLLVGSFLLYLYLHGMYGDNGIDWAMRGVIGWWSSLSGTLTSK